MRVGLTLSGDLLHHDGAEFAAQHNAAAPSRISMTIRGTPAWTDFPPAARQPDEPIPDGMVWNVRNRDGRTSRLPCACLKRSPGSAHLVFAGLAKHSKAQPRPDDGGQLSEGWDASAL